MTIYTCPEAQNMSAGSKIQTLSRTEAGDARRSPRMAAILQKFRNSVLICSLGWLIFILWLWSTENSDALASIRT